MPETQRTTPDRSALKSKDELKNPPNPEPTLTARISGLPEDQNSKESQTTPRDPKASIQRTLIFIDLGTSAWGSLGADLARGAPRGVRV